MSKFVLFVWVLAYGSDGGVATTTIEFESVEQCRAAAAQINAETLSRDFRAGYQRGPRAMCIRRRAD